MPPAGPAARAIAVYAEALSADEGAPERLRPAGERGFEGVACVDDAARAAVLFCTLWRARRITSARTTAEGLLGFLAYMQDDDGRFANFILDWDGRQNRMGETSYPGGPQWQARALHALAWGVATFGAEWEERFQRALRWLDDPLPYLDVRAVCVLAALVHWQATGSPASAERAARWATEIARERRGDGALVDAAGVEAVHLWGHLQEAALAKAGHLLDRPDLVECARASADALLLPAAERCATAQHLLPFDVSCVVSGLVAVAQATGNGRYADGAARARSWFHGQNAAGELVYDPARSLVYDGLDEGRVSRNSGAESNVEGALALLD